MSYWSNELYEAEKGKLSRILKFLLNFPRDDVITTYKWNCVLCQWGSLSNLLTNFRNVVLHEGFVGFMSAKVACQILKKFEGDNILVRFSLSRPELLAIDYSCKSVIVHERKPPQVDISFFLRDTLKGKDVVPVKLVWEKLDKINTIEDYMLNPVWELS
eukprot:TRINITY_DN24934_c0_g1_i1.p1 TRINITY_DN24934_c0_g1~~TRINITY_DN24934_c0_g1_i1.p1  ORF type:complete len:159 (-),score=23.27 TRINITY_DN24934_c0_g1_i1:157-633(-)